MNSFNWPFTPGTDLTPQQLLEVYNGGFPAVLPNPVEAERCFEAGILLPSGYIDDLVKDNPGNGRRALLYRYRERFDPGAFGSEAQTTGDCVSHGDRNARDTTRCVEIALKGESEEYLLRGATEPTYGARGHSGAGMDPFRAARFVVEVGWLVRKNYEKVVDLSTYNSSIGTRWGRSGVPAAVQQLCTQHKVGSYVKCDTPDQAMALFYNGYAGHSGQNVGFSSTPNNDGIHERRGRWNHDMATVGYDDTKEIWPRRVYFVANSWGAHNQQWYKWKQDSQLQAIFGPPITGMIVVDAEVWEEYFLDGMYFYKDVEGFQVRKLPDYGTSSFLP